MMPLFITIWQKSFKILVPVRRWTKQLEKLRPKSLKASRRPSLSGSATNSFGDDIFSINFML